MGRCLAQPQQAVARWWYNGATDFGPPGILRRSGCEKGRAMRRLLIAGLLLACCGCQEDYDLVSAKQLRHIVDSDPNADEKIAPVPRWVYLGTDNSYHYFCRLYDGEDIFIC